MCIDKTTRGIFNSIENVTRMSMEEVHERLGFSRPLEANGFLERVIEEKGACCGNCGEWRILYDEREIEVCQTCGDEAFDIFEINEAI